MKTKFEMGDLDLIFKVTEVIQSDNVKDGFLSISQEIFYLMHQGKTKTKFEPGDFDLIFKVNRGHLRRWHLRWFPLNFSRNIRLIFTKFGTQKHQGKKKTGVQTV